MTGTTVLQRLAREQHGAAALEFAMVAPALCLTIMGIFDLGYNVYAATMVQGAIQHAARETRASICA
jgi:Flp pilus assembly protein TadG